MTRIPHKQCVCLDCLNVLEMPPDNEPIRCANCNAVIDRELYSSFIDVVRPALLTPASRRGDELVHQQCFPSAGGVDFYPIYYFLMGAAASGLTWDVIKYSAAKLIHNFRSLDAETAFDSYSEIDSFFATVTSDNKIKEFISDAKEYFPNAISNSLPGNRPCFQPLVREYEDSDLPLDTIHISRAGGKYHAQNCRHIVGKPTIDLSTRAAILAGFTACNSCSID